MPRDVQAPTHPTVEPVVVDLFPWSRPAEVEDRYAGPARLHRIERRPGGPRMRARKRQRRKLTLTADDGAGSGGPVCASIRRDRAIDLALFET